MIRMEEPEAPSLELTPLVDMVFLLLIFFLVATTFHQTEREIAIALPEAATAQPISAALREIVINVDAQGAVVVNGRSLTLEELTGMISRAVEANAEQKVTVRGDRSVVYEAIVRVLDACLAGGVQEPFLDTVITGPVP